jgi:dihydroorotase
LTDGAEANEGLPATILGLRGWPAAAEASAVARDLAILADVVRDVPGARLHLTHLSTAGSLELVRRAKAAGLPVTCDVTPHHLALTDDWLLGERRFAWELAGRDHERLGPRHEPAAGPRYDSALRVNPPLRSRADAAACLEALVDGTVDAIATDHAPHTAVDKDVEFGLAANGISGLETALGIVLELVGAGRMSLERAIAALTIGPSRVLAPGLARARGGGERGGPGRAGAVSLAVGQPADLVVFDPMARWTVTEATLASRGKNTPLLGRSLPGEVLVTVANGRLAFEAPLA